MAVEGEALVLPIVAGKYDIVNDIIKDDGGSSVCWLRNNVSARIPLFSTENGFTPWIYSE